MEILELENKKNSLLINLSQKPSNKKAVILLHDFFSYLFEFSDLTKFESYFLEFIQIYIKHLKSYSPFATNPNISEKIINQIDLLSNVEFLAQFTEQLIEVSIKIQHDLNLLKNALSGETSDLILNQKAFFPLLEESIFNDETPIGILETFSIQINKSKTKTSARGIVRQDNNFIIIPSEKEIEEKLIDQVRNSWDAALTIIKKHKKNIDDNHEVIISFDKKEGIYEGNSLGTALTIGYIEKLLDFYNTSIIVNIKPNVAFTGGMESNGKVLKVSKEIIEKKVECVFYSNIKTFVVPKEDEVFANEKLNKLKKDFPKRDLSVIGVNDLSDLLDRRKIADIKKQPVLIRAGKFSKKNWASLTLSFLLFFVIIFSGLIDFDKNPASIKFKKDLAFVENKNGKVLWHVNLAHETTDHINGGFLKYSMKLIDTNNDGINEVLVSDENFDPRKDSNNFGRIACLKNNKDVIWKYFFRDTVSTASGKHTDTYISDIIDVVKENDRRIVYVMTRNLPLYPSSIYKLDLLTGKRIDSVSTLWNAGGITNAIIGDFNNNGKKELAVTAIHNGFQKGVFFTIDIDKLGGQTPAPDNYKFLNLKKAELNNFVLLPKSAYSDLFYRFDVPQPGSLNYNSQSKEFTFSVLEGIRNTKTVGSLIYRFDTNLKLVNLDCDDDFQTRRDSLVANGTLKPPYTNTPEYFNQLKEQLRYWDGEK